MSIFLLTNRKTIIIAKIVNEIEKYHVIKIL